MQLAMNHFAVLLPLFTSFQLYTNNFRQFETIFEKLSVREYKAIEMTFEYEKKEILNSLKAIYKTYTIGKTVNFGIFVQTFIFCFHSINALIFLCTLTNKNNPKFSA